MTFLNLNDRRHGDDLRLPDAGCQIDMTDDAREGWSSNEQDHDYDAAENTW